MRQNERTLADDINLLKDAATLMVCIYRVSLSNRWVFMVIPKSFDSFKCYTATKREVMPGNAIELRLVPVTGVSF